MRSQRHSMDIHGANAQGQTAPKNTVAPSISGLTTQGSTLTAADGTWTGSGTITTTRQWLRDWTPIVGATNATYVLTAADAGAKIRVRVVAKSTVDGARTVAVSNPTATIT